MSAAEPMPSVRRRPIPGLTSQPVMAPSLPPEPPAAPANPGDSRETAEPEHTHDADASAQLPKDTSETPPVSRPTTQSAAPTRWPAADYAATRLANFRVPVDLHDRYRDLVRDAERRHPRLRRASLTEVLIALLEEGPKTADEVAELIWRKRAAEHGGQA
jgi:hypothetical protein